jgi:type IV secretory pathway TraG/TraD family ATPase VirD4
MGWFTRKKPNRPPDNGAYPNARWGDKDDLDGIGAFEPKGLPIGYFEGTEFYDGAPLSDKETKPHRTIIGDTGSWKTTGLYVPLALHDATKDFNLIGVDTAGDYSSLILPWRSKLGRSYVVDPSNMLDEIDIGSSVRAQWSPTADFLNATDPLELPSRAETVTAFTSRSHRGNSETATFFSSLSQRAIQGAIMAQALHAPKNATLPDIIKLFNGDFLGWVRWLFKEKDIAPAIRDLLHPFHVPEKRQFEQKSIIDVIHTVSSETKWILNAAIARSLSGSDFSYAPSTDDVFTVTLCAPLHLLADGYDRFLAMHLGCAATQLQSKRRAKGTIIICDELAQYCSDAISETIARLFATGRKYKCRIFIAVTSLSQLSNVSSTVPIMTCWETQALFTSCMHLTRNLPNS